VAAAQTLLPRKNICLASVSLEKGAGKASALPSSALRALGARAFAVGGIRQLGGVRLLSLLSALMLLLIASLLRADLMLLPGLVLLIVIHFVSSRAETPPTPTTL
jgi:hypothetical protein